MNQISNNLVNRPNTSISYKINKQKPRASGIEQESPLINQVKKVGSNKPTNNILPEINKKVDQNIHNLMSVNDFQDILLKEKDERFRYLLKHGNLKRIEGNGNIIFSELLQIPGIWVCYRRPSEREINMEKLHLDYMELIHVPLLEGEEKLKILTYQHNKITKIENLVSLPSLLYIDFYDNMIKEIDNVNVVSQLRVLLLPKNQISKIKNLDALTKLEVLDLHSNKIQKIENLMKLQNLRILNLANNLLTKIENLDNQSNLVELNLKINLIETLENLQFLTKIEKLFISNNKILDTESFPTLKGLNFLIELNFEGNPVEKYKIIYLKKILINTKNIQILDHRNIDQIKEEIKNEEQKQQTDKKKDKTSIKQLKQDKQQKPPENPQDLEEDNDENINPEEVISIISQQWVKETSRLLALDLQQVNKKEILKGSLVEGGHAEIEDDTILFIFGNAYEIVLSNATFQESIEKIQFQYVVFDFLIEQQTLNLLKSFKKLKEIILKDNHISSLLQFSKLEVLPQLKSIQIDNSPLCKCTFLKEFIVYRFPLINKINGKDVKEIDKQRAKQMFNHFDRILQLPEKFYNVDNIRQYPFEQNEQFEFKKDKHYMKLFTKQVNETSENFAQQVMENIIQNKNGQILIKQTFDNYLQQLIDFTLLSKK